MRSLSSLRKLSVQIRGENRGGLESTKARGLPYYGALATFYPVHLACFKSMHSRSGPLGLKVDFSRSVEGFIEFLRYVGDIPEGMARPTLGRLDHSEGYTRGNFEWQGYAENSSESAARNIKGGNPKMHCVEQSRHLEENKLRLVELLISKGRLTDSQCMRILGNRNVQTFNIVRSLIRRGTLSARTSGTRARGWSLHIL
jgi:hypothetical protein